MRPGSVLLSVVLTLLGLACAGRRGPGPTTATETPSPGPGAPPAGPVVPPPVVESATAPGQAPGSDPTGRGSHAQQERRAIFEGSWTLVRDKHYDKTLGGLDWNAMRSRYEPLALGAPDTATFYRFVNQMLGELGQSHLEVAGPGASPSLAFEPEGPAPPASGDADPGFVLRVIEGRPTVTVVRPQSPAERAGLRPGFIVTHIGGWEVKTSARGGRPLRPVEERFYARLAASRRLMGPPGTRITVKVLDAQDRPGEMVLEREVPKERPVKLGLLPPLYPEVRVSQVGDIGVLAFNLFLSEGVLPRVQSAIDGFRARKSRALVLDLRGNPGGQGAVAIPIAARLTDRPLTLGTLQFRDFNQVFTATPPMGVKPFTGALVIVTDEGTASTAEIFAAGMKEAGRALVVGDTSLGAVLPSQVESLPGGAVIQYVVADFRTPKGILLEGRGVQPDRRVVETRAALLAGRDPVLDAALVAARASRAR